MSAHCAEWPRLEALIAGRLERDGDGAAVLAAPALEHLEACPECRGSAVRLDPTLALRPLAAAEEAGDDEIEAMRQAVAILRRSPDRRPAAHAAWWRVAAAALLVAGALYQMPAGPRAAIAPADAALAELAARPLDTIVVPAEFSRQPVVEDVDRPDARVYQLGGGDVSVVMIVDESLDV